MRPELLHSGTGSIPPFRSFPSHRSTKNGVGFVTAAFALSPTVLPTYGRRRKPPFRRIILPYTPSSPTFNCPHKVQIIPRVTSQANAHRCCSHRFQDSYLGSASTDGTQQAAPTRRGQASTTDSTGLRVGSSTLYKVSPTDKRPDHLASSIGSTPSVGLCSSSPTSSSRMRQHRIYDDATTIGDVLRCVNASGLPDANGLDEPTQAGFLRRGYAHKYLPQIH